MTFHIAYDIECYPNIFTLAMICIENGHRAFFEISTRRDDTVAMMKCLRNIQATGSIMVGFNSLWYDYPLLHPWITGQEPITCENAWRRTRELIDGDDDRNNIIWKPLIKQMDLFKIHHFDNKNMRTGLKALEFAMRMRSIIELPFEIGRYLTSEEMDELGIYNFNDVEATILFFFKSEKQIALRTELSKKYGVDMTNFNDTKIGKQYFIRCLEDSGVPCYDKVGWKRVPRQTQRDSIHLGSLILPAIKFEYPEFQGVVDWLDRNIITETKGAIQVSEEYVKKYGDANFIKKSSKRRLVSKFDNIMFLYGTGGLHGSVVGRKVFSDDEYAVVDVDVKSYYPNLAIAWKFYPEHLGPKFCDIYKMLFDQREQYPKATHPSENFMFKKALNGSFGASNSEYSPLFDPKFTMNITINGQLFLSLLAEMLMHVPTLEIVQANTDGITYRCKRCYLSVTRPICARWEKLSKLQLEESVYSAMYIRDVNNYIAVYAGDKDHKAGETKAKGAYLVDKAWSQDPSGLIIAKAAQAEILYGIPAHKTVLENDDIMDFMLRAKAGKKARLMANFPDGSQDQIQRTTRCYVTTSEGVYLEKIMAPLAKNPDKERHVSIYKGKRVHICNDIRQFSEPIDYDYYIGEARKLIDPLH